MYLSVLAIFHNESHIMKEWMEHYLAEGVDYFYLINNFSTDDFLPILQQHGTHVTLINSCTPNDQFMSAQLVSYDYMLREHIKHNTEWLIIVDLDEFMYASDPHVTLKQELEHIEKRIQNVACVRVPWKMFGSNGHISQPRSVVKNFTKRERYIGTNDVQIKNIFKPHCIECIGIHEVFLLPDYVTINSNGVNKNGHSIYQTEENIAERSISSIRLNHYCLQSKEYWTDVKMKRVCVNINKLMDPPSLTLEQFNDRDSQCIDVTDIDLYLKHKALYDSI